MNLCILIVKEAKEKPFMAHVMNKMVKSGSCSYSKANFFAFPFSGLIYSGVSDEDGRNSQDIICELPR